MAHIRSTTSNELNIGDYDYDLPQDKIALYPNKERDKSKLLVWDGKTLKDRLFTDITTLLPSNASIILNNSKVIPARLLCKKETGGQVEVFCLEPYKQSYDEALKSTQCCIWKCLVGNLKKWKRGVLTCSVGAKTGQPYLSVQKVEQPNSEAHEVWLRFSWEGDYTFIEILNLMGTVPIPPYLERRAEKLDEQRYQTIFSEKAGSVAAPTAGLHFTKKVLKELFNQGIRSSYITLHVGAATFLPVKGDSISNHPMHREYVSVSKQTILNLKKNLSSIVAVGTTSMRTLESLYWYAVEEFPSEVSQWIWQEQKTPLSPMDALRKIEEFLEKNNLVEVTFPTRLMITPGYSFKIVTHLLTNFHQPRSTLLLLVAAAIGSEWKTLYNHALKNNYRFLSYGDSSLLTLRR